MGLKDLCQHVHELYAKYDIARLTTEMYLSDLTPAMKPSDAYAHIAQRKTERVENRPPGRPHHRGSGHALPARHSAADSWRSVQQEDRGLPASLPATLPRSAPALRPTSTVWWKLEDENGEVRYYADCVA